MKKPIQHFAYKIILSVLSGLVFFGFPLHALALNAIQIENAIPSIPGVDSQWTNYKNPALAHTIEGYTDKISVNPGSSINFYVNSNAALNSTYSLTVYRLGYYNGVGARRMSTPVSLASTTQVLPTPDASNGFLTECNWINPYSLTIPANWTSGIYIATIVGDSTKEGNSIAFVVTQPSSTAAYVFHTSDTTWQAYNAWGGKSLYAFNSSNAVPATKISYNRPLDTSNGLGILLKWEIQTLRFLEKNGYDVTYQSNIDTHLGGAAQLLQHKAFLSVGHDEYWSKAMRDHVENAKSQGLSLAFLGANAVYWQIRLENSPLNAAANRTIVAYKQAAANDPIANPAITTSTWRDPLYANRPENALIGVMYVYDPVNSDIVVSNAAHWAYTGSGLVNGSKLTGLLGYEVDAFVSNGFEPAGVEILAHSPTNVAAIYSDVTIYTQACTVIPCVNSTATVFATGSMQWAWGLDSFFVGINLENAGVQQITHNVLARMVNPAVSLPGIPPSSINDAPSFVGANPVLTLPFNSPAADLKPLLHVSDINLGQTVTWTQALAPLHGTLVINVANSNAGTSDITPGGTITYQPDGGYFGTDSFSISVSDGSTTDMRTISVTLAPPANISPVFLGANPNLNVAHNSAPIDLKNYLHISDSDVGQTEIWSQSVAPQHGTLLISGATANSGSADITPAGILTYQPTAGYSGSDSFTIQVSDGIGTTTRSFTLTVSALNTGNLIINPSLEVDADANNRPDCWLQAGYGSNTAIWTRTSDAHSGSFAQQLQITTYTTGDRKMLQTLDNGQGSGGCAPIVITGATYQISAFYKSTASSRVLLFYLDANNVWQYWKNGPTLAAAANWTQMTYAIGSLPAGAKAISFGIGLTGIGTLVTDDYALVATNASNTVPIFLGGNTSLNLPQNSAAIDLKPNLRVSDTDVGQTESWTQRVAPLHGTLLISGATANSGSADITPAGTITYQPEAGYTGSDSFSIQVSDGTGSASQTFSVSITAPPNTSPTFVAGTNTLSLPQNSLAIDLKPNLHVSDIDLGQTLTWSQSSAPLHGTLLISGATASSGSSDITPAGTITYQPEAGYTGSDSFSIQASDGPGSASQTFSVSITAPLNTAPTFVGGTNTLTLPQNSLAVDLIPNLHVSDIDVGQTLTWSQSSAPLHGTLLISGATASSGSSDITPAGTITYQPEAGYTGSDSFSIQASDGPGSASQTFSVSITAPLNTAPTFVAGTNTLTLPQNSLAVDLIPNLHVSDIDVGQTETWTQSLAPLHGTLVLSGATASSGSADITPAGSITYQPAAGFIGSDSFSIQVSDGVASSIRNFTIAVSNPSLGPNLVINPSLEIDADANNVPDCWLQGGYGANIFTWTRTSDAHSGSFAQQLQITSYTSGDRKMLPFLDNGQNLGRCAPAIVAGARYEISAYYKSSVSSRALLFYLDANNVWQYWKSGPTLAVASTWTQMTFAPGVLPIGAKALSFGIGLTGIGTLITDDYAIMPLL